VGRGLAPSVCQPPVPSPQPRSLSPWGERWAYGAYQGNIYDERFASLGRRDAESTLDPTLFRMYESRLYRWLSPDPLAGSILNPQSLNRYAYVLNNPVNFIDPLGLDGCGESWVSYGGYVDAYGYHETNRSSGTNPPCDTVSSLLPLNRFAVQNWIRTISFYIQLERAMAALRERQNALTPERIAALGLRRDEAATQYCQDRGQLAFNIPFTNIPVTATVSGTLGVPNYSWTNDWSVIIPTTPAPSLGISIDVTVNAPAQPSLSVNVGAGKNLSVGTFLTPNGPQGLTFSVGPSIGPPVTISAPMGNTCGQFAPKGGG